MSKQSKFQYLIYSLLLALLIGGLIMWATGSNPFAVYAAVLTGSFGSLSSLMSVLAYTTPLILTGLGAVVAFQGGVFNIGGEGQLLVGGLAAVLTGIYVDLPQPLPLLLALIAGFAAGALWARRLSAHRRCGQTPQCGCHQGPETGRCPQDGHADRRRGACGKGRFRRAGSG